MTPTNRWNRTRYRLYAPIYDIVARPLERGRRRAIARLDPRPSDRILLVGCGTGMDLDYLPEEAAVTAVDLTPTMVRRTEARAEALDRTVGLAVGDAHTLPFEDDAFDAVLLHLVLSVVPDPEAVVEETTRVLSPDGRVSIYDKFAPADADPSLARRVANPVARLLFADLNRPLEPMVAGTPLDVARRESFLGGLYTATVARPSVEE
ncbi:class I SAM-dependent methyltransferase [Halorussus aquaticus]|uniref:Class I SAM-dependent methyltransferase n=1 Tax=Halorussus aquaticus TaxID=2953748 RepID=A0ABD5Q1X3_9EURY|nr:methyltransferase domain-containing protein [Halorussus aquaticus]